MDILTGVATRLTNDFDHLVTLKSRGILSERYLCMVGLTPLTVTLPAESKTMLLKAFPKAFGHRSFKGFDGGIKQDVSVSIVWNVWGNGNSPTITNPF